MERRDQQAFLVSESASTISPKRKLVNNLRIHNILAARINPGESSVTTKSVEAPSKTIMPESHGSKVASEIDWNGNESIQGMFLFRKKECVAISHFHPLT